MFENEFEDIEPNNNEEIKPEQNIQAEDVSNQGAEENVVADDTLKEDVVVTEFEAETIDKEEEVYIPEDNGIKFEEVDRADENGSVTVQPVKFASFDQLNQVAGDENSNLDILMDVKLQLNVELGRCELPIKKVLELTRGSIIELDKIAGEPVELFANGKLIAHGEVVVIDDNFGLRITSITEPDDRLN